MSNSCGVLCHAVPCACHKNCCGLLCCVSPVGPEPGLTRDPTYGWIKHGSLNLQLVDTAGWKKATALQPTQSPTASPNLIKAAGSGSTRGTLSSGSTGKGVAATAAAGAVVGEGSEEELQQQLQQQQQDAVDVMLGKQMADASLAQARRALGACHVAVLLLDAARLLTIEQVGHLPIVNL
jgi:hypothetical protein